MVLADRLQPAPERPRMSCAQTFTPETIARSSIVFSRCPCGNDDARLAGVWRSRSRSEWPLHVDSGLLLCANTGHSLERAAERQLAYEEGLSDGWTPMIRGYWQYPSPGNREALCAFLKPETTVWQYTHGVPNYARVSPGRVLRSAISPLPARRGRGATQSVRRL
jgi:hypothetical protein